MATAAVAEEKEEAEEGEGGEEEGEEEREGEMAGGERVEKVEGEEEEGEREEEERGEEEEGEGGAEEENEEGEMGVVENGGERRGNAGWRVKPTPVTSGTYSNHPEGCVKQAWSSEKEQSPLRIVSSLRFSARARACCKLASRCTRWGRHPWSWLWG